MMGLIIAIHIIACIGLIFFILIQTGKGGGLVETFSSVESIFGTKTNTFLTKATSVLAVTFFITCLLLAFFSVQQNKSIVERKARRQAVNIGQTDIAQENQKNKEEKQQTDTKQETPQTDAAKESAATNQ
ncbi:MAG: preprotein translocase subunit SecG [Candidatus Omnitrophica bacterium]|nr:preprotein translocase subunit SecG [Candidatus Omnitrophota bacterium]MDD5352351.1 preprotein translocase subunit SecG [Candidatus Omnitrophota bacterium]MDD5549949.1 preprotein translocase subunit SecG [Candidatus Omnitrophota bacterium]